MYDDGEESGDEALVVTITSYPPYIANTGWLAIENTVAKLISLGKTIPM